MNYENFQQIFILAEPKYTEREIAQMYSNIIRNAGVNRISKNIFKKLIHQLMNDGVIFPLVKHSKYGHQHIIKIIIRHWCTFREFYTHLYTILEHSENEQDIECAVTLKNIVHLLQKEITKNTHSRRLVSLYRGLLNVILSHQSAWMLVSVTTPTQMLHTELRVLEHVILQRHKLYDQHDTRLDNWLETLNALEFMDDQDEQMNQQQDQGGNGGNTGNNGNAGNTSNSGGNNNPGGSGSGVSIRTSSGGTQLGKLDNSPSLVSQLNSNTNVPYGINFAVRNNDGTINSTQGNNNQNGNNQQGGNNFNNNNNNNNYNNNYNNNSNNNNFNNNNNNNNNNNPFNNNGQFHNNSNQNNNSNSGTPHSTMFPSISSSTSSAQRSPHVPHHGLPHHSPSTSTGVSDVWNGLTSNNEYNEWNNTPGSIGSLNEKTPNNQHRKIVNKTNT
jgi:hypothetical protein